MIYYYLICEDVDTRILKFDDVEVPCTKYDENYRFDTYEEAKAAALNYINEMISGLQAAATEISAQDDVD